MSAWLVLAGALVSVLSVLGVIFAVNYVREGLDGRSAAQRTTSGAIGVTSGVVLSGLVVAAEVLDAILMAVTTAPEAFVTLVVGIVGYLSIEGILTVQPETYGLLVIIGFVVVVLGHDKVSG